MERIYILWDASRIWGLMAWRSLSSLGLPCRLTSAKEIAQGGVLGKRCALLLAPGGSARRKAATLGQRGLEAIRGWIAAGGAYLGICGGAGLALSQEKPADGLGLCPWRRASYPDRISHLLSGYVFARKADNGSLLPLPIWWPGRFAGERGRAVTTLAEYASPGADLWLADSPVPKTEGGCKIVLSPGQPLVVGGNYGQGRYILSYAHLETPESPEANEWLCELVARLSGLYAKRRHVPAWHSASSQISEPRSPWCIGLANLAHVMDCGERLGLFFRRSSWLWGWRHGIAGMALNNLLAAYGALCAAGEQALEPAGIEPGAAQLEEFCASAERLFHSFHPDDAGAVDGATARECLRLFGHPMLGGGVAEGLLSRTDALIHQLRDHIHFIN